MADACLNCVYKHLCKAMVIHEDEVLLGYPKHIRRVIGNLDEASRESVKVCRELALAIREHRLAVMDDPNYFPPYDLLLDYVELVIECQNQEMPIPAFPDELKFALNNSSESN